MYTVKYVPSFPLSQYVEFIWLAKADGLNIQSSHHAALFTELIFNYGDTFDIAGQNIESIVNKDEHHLISGLKTSPFQTTVQGRYASVGLVLKPFCYGMLRNKFGTKSMEIVSEILFEHIFMPVLPNFEIVEPHLLSLFDGQKMDLDLVKFEKYISTEILKKGAMKDFNLQLSITQKSFIQKFKKHYVLTPNQYAKLRQVNYAMQLLQNLQTENLIHVGLDAGFYDQSHFIKVFKKFCGETPKNFKSYEKE